MGPHGIRYRPFMAVAGIGLAFFLASAAYFFILERRQADGADHFLRLYSLLQQSVYETESSLMHFLATANKNQLVQHREAYDRAGRIIAEIRGADSVLPGGGVSGSSSTTAGPGCPTSVLAESLQRLERDLADWNEAYAIPASEAKSKKEPARLGGLTRKGTGPRYFDRVKESLMQARLHIDQTLALHHSRSKRLERASIAGAGLGLALFLGGLGLLLMRQRSLQLRAWQELAKSDELALYAEKLHHANSPAQAARSLAQALTQLGNGSAVLLREGSHEMLVVKDGPSGLQESRAGSPLLEDYSRCAALRTGKPLSAAAKNHPCDCPLGIPRSGNSCCVPLLAQGQVVGLASVGLSGRAGEIPGEVQTLVRISSLALDSLLLLESARQEAVTDRLTGLFNRRFFEGFLEKQLQAAMRQSLPLSLLMLDLDHFKALNDRHGHQTGDAVLKSFARVMTENIREGDLASRFGGEEFAIVLPATGLETAREIAERIRAAAEKLPVRDSEADAARMTVSIGIAAFPENGARAADLVAAADAALYRAKQTGRNRLALAS